MRVYALIPVKEALGVDGLADLQGLYSGIYIRGSVAEVGLYNEGIGLAVIGNVKVQIVAFRAASIPVVKESDVIAVRILSCGLHSQSLKGGQLVLVVDELVLAQKLCGVKGLSDEFTVHKFEGGVDDLYLAGPLGLIAGYLDRCAGN